MERFADARSFIEAMRPERAVFGLRPHASGRAAKWFLDNFPGEVAYAYKANSSVFLVGSLYGAGIRNFDVASLPELEDAATIPKAQLHFMHPVKSRMAIRRAYHEFGVKCFALDSEAELEKILEETEQAKDLQLYVRLTVPSKDSGLPLEHKFGIADEAAKNLLIKTRQSCDELGIAFHVGSQTTTTDSFQLAFDMVRKSIVEAGVVVDAIDCGGGFPARYSEEQPAALGEFMSVIEECFESLPISHDAHLICEPGRALVAEAESLIVRVDHRRGNELFITDGGYGALFDAAHLDFVFPVRLVGQEKVPLNRCKPFQFWGPTCDSVDYMKGPFYLPDSVQEGDYIEIGNMGAYGRAIAGNFNGYGNFGEVILDDEPMYSMFADEPSSLAQDV